MPDELLARQVDVWEVCLPYWEAFSVLSPSRPWFASPEGAQPGYIPYSEIAAYAKDHGCREDPNELDLFVFLVQQLDAVYIDHARKMAEKARAKR